MVREAGLEIVLSKRTMQRELKAKFDLTKKAARGYNNKS